MLSLHIVAVMLQVYSMPFLAAYALLLHVHFINLAMPMFTGGLSQGA